MIIIYLFHLQKVSNFASRKCADIPNKLGAHDFPKNVKYLAFQKDRAILQNYLRKNSFSQKVVA